MPPVRFPSVVWQHPVVLTCSADWRQLGRRAQSVRGKVHQPRLSPESPGLLEPIARSWASLSI